MIRVKKNEEERPLEDLTLGELWEIRWRLLEEIKVVQEVINKKSAEKTKEIRAELLRNCEMGKPLADRKEEKKGEEKESGEKQERQRPILLKSIEIPFM